MRSSENENVAARTPAEPVYMEEVARHLLHEAATNGTGRSAVTLTPDPGDTVSQSVLAIRSGHAVGPAS